MKVKREKILRREKRELNDDSLSDLREK